MAENVKANENESVIDKAKKPKKEKMVSIKIPVTEKERGDVFVSVNERTFLIKRGVRVEVPEYVYEVLCRRDDMLSYAYEQEQKLANENI